MALLIAIEPIRHDGIDYAPGDPLDVADPAPLLALGAAVAAPEPAPRSAPAGKRRAAESDPAATPDPAADLAGTTEG